jgi:hypothetical protein
MRADGIACDHMSGLRVEAQHLTLAKMVFAT